MPKPVWTDEDYLGMAKWIVLDSEFRETQDEDFFNDIHKFLVALYSGKSSAKDHPDLHQALTCPMDDLLLLVNTRSFVAYAVMQWRYVHNK